MIREWLIKLIVEAILKAEAKRIECENNNKNKGLASQLRGLRESI